jgi:hypothetical protein
MELSLFSESWWFPDQRLDFLGLGPGTENRSGALLAQIVISALWLALVWRRWVGLLGVFIATFSMVLLLQTQSRGALIAVAVAIAVLLWKAWKQNDGLSHSKEEKPPKRTNPLWGLTYWISCLLILALLAIYAYQLGVTSRIEQSISGVDGSTQVRLDIYQAGLRMLVDAPWGWGDAADAYTQWYQKVGANSWYLSLLNSHLTWMNQYGWSFGVSYILVWSVIFLLLLNGAVSPKKLSSRLIWGTRSTALAVWIVLWITACFSHVLSWWGMWVIPVLWLLAALCIRAWCKDWPTTSQWRYTVSGAVSIVLALFIVGWGLGIKYPVIYGGAQRVVMEGEGVLRVVVYGVDKRVLGDHYGHTVRECLSDWSRVEVCQKPVYDGEVPDVLLIAGSCLSEDIVKLPMANRTVLLNPVFREDWETLLEGHQVLVVIGGHSDWIQRNAWKEFEGKRPDWEWLTLRWAGDFIPNWGTFVLPSEIHDEGDELTWE